MRYYTTQKLGPHRELTPEGFLICRDVPIARTGMQIYGPGETPVAGGPDGISRIHRRPEDVFRAATLESFNGKPVVLDHPGFDVTPANWKQLSVGFVLDPRRGSDAEDDLLLADMVITDEDAIRRVLEDGLAEVSCGYDAGYEEESPGVGYQVEILGNHVALVEAGRCGARCSIRDSEVVMNIRERIRAALAAKDDKGLDEALNAVPTGEPETHIHIHTADSVLPSPSSGSTIVDEEKEEKKTDDKKDDKDEEETEDKAMKATIRDAVKDALGDTVKRLDAIDQRLGKLEDGKTADKKAAEEEEVEDEETEDEEEEEEKTEDVIPQVEKEIAIEKGMNPAARDGVTDSRYLETSISETLSLAEVLSPGISFPAFDRAFAPGKTVQILDTLRKRSLLLAASTPVGAAMIAELRGGHPLTQKAAAKMTVKDARTLFRAAAGQAKLGNQVRQHDTGVPMSVPRTGPITLAEINRRNREFWEKRA